MSTIDQTEKTLVQAVMDAGLVGEGGAGFPAHVKYDTQIDTLIANGCECEPLLFSDQYIMAQYPEKISRAMTALKATTHAKKAVIAIKAKYTEVAERLTQAIKGSDVELALVDNFYPAGDEQILIHELTGDTIPPLGLPKDKGFLVANVGTLMSVSNAMDNIPLTQKVITVTGEVGNPAIVTAPIGTSITECIDACGGMTTPNPVVVLGGPMMGRFLDDPDQIDAQVVTKTTGGIIVLPENHYLQQMAGLSLDAMARRASNACIQCRMCSEMCPRYLVGQQFETHRVMRAFAGGNEHPSETLQATMCCECGVCELFACPMGLSPRRINAAFKQRYGKEGIQYQGPKKINPLHTQYRAYRKIPTPRLAMKINIGAYMDIKPAFLSDIQPDQVRIPLHQHIGAPAVPVVKPGDRVVSGELIADIAPKTLGAKIHASINGRITHVDDAITIKGS